MYSFLNIYGRVCLRGSSLLGNIKLPPNAKRTEKKKGKISSRKHFAEQIRESKTHTALILQGFLRLEFVQIYKRARSFSVRGGKRAPL